ncbi:MAG: 2-dehydropantoate 2-reductase N-terminal domain-containing protein [Dehalococcoidia bacterium]
MSGPGELALGRDDVIVLAMKSQDTPGALAALEAAGEQDCALLIAQNGVENERAALRRFARVYTTTVMLPATHPEPGVVQATNSAPMTGILDMDAIQQAWTPWRKPSPRTSPPPRSAPSRAGRDGLEAPEAPAEPRQCRPGDLRRGALGRGG